MRSRFKFTTFTLRSRDQRSNWMQDGCEFYMHSYMASKGSCFMVSGTIFQNHPLEVGPTQNPETMALQTLTTIGLFYFIMCEDPHEYKIHWNSLWLRARSHMSSHYTWGSGPHYMMLEVCWGRFGHSISFGLSQFPGHGSWLVCEVDSGPH